MSEPLRMDFENGRLTKIDHQRPEYMGGQRLIELVRQLAGALNEINNIVYANPSLSREDYFRIRFLARTGAEEPKEMTDDQA